MARGGVDGQDVCVRLATGSEVDHVRLGHTGQSANTAGSDGAGVGQVHVANHSGMGHIEAGARCYEYLGITLRRLSSN